MTDSSVRANAADELRLAESALLAAEALLDLGLAPDAASRTYYAAFHAARALIYSIGMEPRSHHGVHTLLQRHFVVPGELRAERAKDLLQLEALRSAGDYDSAFALGVAEIRPEVEKARAFIADARALLHKGGWIP